MEIDNSTYTLTEKNYYLFEDNKKQIIIGNTFNTKMNHFIGWQNRLGGNYKKVSNFTIDREGKIYQHFDSKYYSDFLPNSIYNKQLISIVLVNQGWLEYDVKEKKYIDSLGNYYENDDNMTERRWRNHTFWDNYTDNQIDSLIDLTKYLLEKHKITKNILGHNTYIKEVYNFEGVTYRSNWIKDCTDLSPSFDFDIFKDKIEEHGIQ